MESLWLSGRASERGILISEAQFLMGTQNVFYDSRSCQDEKHFYPILIRLAQRVLLMDQLIIPKLIYFFILNTHLVDIELILKGEILSWSLMRVKGSKWKHLWKHVSHFLFCFFVFSFLFRVDHILQRAKVSKNGEKRMKLVVWKESAILKWKII